MATKKKAATKKGRGFLPKFVGTEPEMIRLEGLTPNDWNPNEMTADERRSLRETLRTKGWSKSQPLLVWASDERGRRKNVIVDGEHRWVEARRLGFVEGPAVLLHKTSRADAVAWTIRLDKIRGRFNDAKIARVLDVELGAFKAGAIDNLQIGFGAAELARLAVKVPATSTGATPAPSSANDDDEIPEPPRVPVTKVGDLWILGDHRLVCGDSFVLEVRRKAFGDVTALDWVECDPPYAIFGSSTGIGQDIADDKMVRPFFEATFRTIAEHLKMFGHAYVHCDWRSWAAIVESARRAEIAVKNCIVWDKGGSGLGSCYAMTHEFVGFFAKLPKATAMKSTEKRGQRTVNAPNVVRFNRPYGEERQHNAAKPVDMIRGFLVKSSDRGDVGGDFFGGSGTVLIAAEREERRSCTIELEPKWCDVIVERWQKLAGAKAKRIAA